MADEVRGMDPREALLETLLQKTAKDRAASQRYNTHALALSYGTLAVVVVMGLLGVSVIIVGVTAVAGLLAFLLFTQHQGKKLEKQLYQEELFYYKELTASRLAVPVQTPSRPSAIEASEGQVAVIDAATISGENPLTPREMEILTLIAKGNMNKEIAKTLGLSTHTIRNYTVQILKKMEVDDRTAAAVIAISRGWIKS